MTREDVERILKQGSVREKIKLYMTDIALLNVDDSHLDYQIKDTDINIKGTKLLSNIEKNMLWSSIKTPKDIKYYEDLTTWNGAFVLFKDKFIIELVKLRAIYYKISIDNSEEIKRNECKNLINEILDLIPDKKTREITLKKAVQLTKRDGGKTYQEKGYPKYLDTDRYIYWISIEHSTKMAIVTAKNCKEYIVMFKTVLANSLPLKPYKDWVEKQEKQLKNVITAIYNITVLEDTPPDFPKIEIYQKIIAEITNEDVKHFKRAGR